MISAKSGHWWEKNPQRGRANNSVVLMRHLVTEEFFKDLWFRVRASGAGEPDFIFQMIRIGALIPAVRLPFDLISSAI